MERITDRHLDGMCLRLNRLTGNPETYATRKDDGTMEIHVGHYHVDKAYGGNQLVQTCNAGGGVRNVLTGGFVTKRELYERLYAYLRGIEDQMYREEKVLP